MNTEALNLLNEGFTVVTATNSLARYFRESYAIEQINNGKHTWETADAITWNTWVSRNWEEYRVVNRIDSVVIDQFQQYVIWKSIIEKSIHAKELLHIGPVISEVSRSYAVCKSWNIPIFPGKSFLNKDAWVFREWVTEYETRLKENNWTDAESLPDLLRQGGISSHNSNKIIFAGFQDFTPQQAELLQTWYGRDLESLKLATSNRNNSIQAISYSDLQSELSSAAAFARQICEREEHSSVGIIVPELDKYRDDILSIFERILNPSSLVTLQDSDSYPFSISLGKSLATYPVIRTAFLILGLGTRRISRNDLGKLLTTPFIKSANMNWYNWSQLELQLRNKGRAERTLQELIFEINELALNNESVTVFLNLLKESELLFLSRSGRQRTSDWAEQFTRLLDLFGWPGDRELSSSEYQQVSAWKECLSQLAELDNILPELDYYQVVSQIRDMATQKHFQPESVEARIQIMNTTGAAAMEFQHLWICGLHDEAWPPGLQDFPLIPTELIKGSGHPFASPESVTRYADDVLGNLVSSARNVILSFPRTEMENRKLVSPLVQKHISEIDEGEAFLDDFRLRIQESSSTEEYSDKVSKIVIGKKIRGGTAILSDQSRCPFQSFIRHRLKADSSRSAELGFDAMERGIVVHFTLQNFWRVVKTSKILNQFSPDELNSTVKKAVQSAMQSIPAHYKNKVNPNFLVTEAARVEKTVLDWLLIEKERKDFSVRETETSKSVSLGNLEIAMKIDRVDEMENGDIAILDYKTGQVNINHWFGDRPENLQLPIYAVVNEVLPSALCYARVRLGSSRFYGLGYDSELLPGIKSETYSNDGTWRDQIAKWETQVQQFAMEFQNGNADVDPVSEDVCTQCNLQSVCRIFE